MTEFTIDPLILSVRIRVSPSSTEYRAITGVRRGARISRLEAWRSSRGVGFFRVTLREITSERDICACISRECRVKFSTVLR
jgi:hypothetical protein